jgi:(2R)-3-sulfolactate dehydrogenase (NADP+)
VAGHHVEALADRGLAALMIANTPSAMAPWGGRKALLGTNPLAFAAPMPDAAPLVIDMALTEVARGKIVAAARDGKPIPLGWAVDRDGKPTTDAKAALAGTLLPAGGAKGAALALMVEILATGLAGATLAFEASSFLDAEGPPPATGQLLIAIDPEAMSGGGAMLASRMTALAHAFSGDGARLPGSRRLEARAKVERDGLAVDARLLAEVKALAGKA